MSGAGCTAGSRAWALRNRPQVCLTVAAPMPLKQDLGPGSPSTDPHYNEAAGSYRLCHNRPKGNALEIPEAVIETL